MNGWIKFYADGTQYVGDDELVRTKAASWRLSPNQNIVSVSVQHDNFLGKIQGPGEYWQSDTYESVFPGVARMTARRIQRKMEPSDHFFKVAQSDNSIVISFNDRGFQGKAFVMKRDWVGQWMTIVYDITSGTCSYRMMGQM